MGADGEQVVRRELPEGAVRWFGLGPLGRFAVEEHSIRLRLCADFAGNSLPIAYRIPGPKKMVKTDQVLSS